MNVDPMNKDTIPVDYISSEQNPHVNNQINKMKKTPMTPTPLYVSISFLC